MADVFFDTNILIYLVGNDLQKADATHKLVGMRGTISVQVLNEATLVARRKLGFSWEEIDLFLQSIRAKCSVVPLTVATHERGLTYAARYRLGVYDGMIVAAAVLAGWTTLYSEDMHDGLVIDGVTVHNPYKA